MNDHDTNAMKSADEITENSNLNLSQLSEADLVAAIKSSYAVAESGIISASQQAHRLLKAALETGGYLREAQQRAGKGEGKWKKWMKEHCPDLPLSTAYRYIQLSEKFSHVGKPEDIQNLRQAYIAVGILKMETEKKSKGSAGGSKWIAKIKSWRAFYQASWKKADPAKIEAPVREKLANEIKALIADLQKFEQAISSDNVVTMGH